MAEMYWYWPIVPVSSTSQRVPLRSHQRVKQRLLHLVGLEELADVVDDVLFVLLQAADVLAVAHGLDGLFAHALATAGRHVRRPLVPGVLLAGDCDDAELALYLGQGGLEPDVGARLHDLLRQTGAVQQHAERPGNAVQRRDDGVNLVVLVILNVSLFR